MNVGIMLSSVKPQESALELLYFVPETVGLLDKILKRVVATKRCRCRCTCLNVIRRDVSFFENVMFGVVFALQAELRRLSYKLLFQSLMGE